MQKRFATLIMIATMLFASGCFSHNEDFYDATIKMIPDEAYEEKSASVMDKYREFLMKDETITPEANPVEFEQSTTFNVHDLYYCTWDLDYNGIEELICSTEPIGGNGVQIYTYKNGKVIPFTRTYMPYSASGKTCTVAEINGRYGILELENNGSDKFSLTGFDGSNILSGDIQNHPDGSADFFIDGEQCSPDTWYGRHGEIELVVFEAASEFFRR